jgi:hypothetical protein
MGRQAASDAGGWRAEHNGGRKSSARFIQAVALEAQRVGQLPGGGGKAGVTELRAYQNIPKGASLTRADGDHG